MFVDRVIGLERWLSTGWRLKLFCCCYLRLIISCGFSLMIHLFYSLNSSLNTSIIMELQMIVFCHFRFELRQRDRSFLVKEGWRLIGQASCFWSCICLTWRLSHLGVCIEAMAMVFPLLFMIIFFYVLFLI